MTPVEQLRTTLAALSLTAIDARLEGLLENAAKKEPSYGDFLLEVMNTEADARRQRYLKGKRSKFPSGVSRILRMSIAT